MISKRSYGIVFLFVFLLLTLTASAYWINGAVIRAVLPEAHAMGLVGIGLVGIAGLARRVLSVTSGTKDNPDDRVFHTERSQLSDVSQVLMATRTDAPVGSSVD